MQADHIHVHPEFVTDVGNPNYDIALIEFKDGNTIPVGDKTGTFDGSAVFASLLFLITVTVVIVKLFEAASIFFY